MRTEARIGTADLNREARGEREGGGSKRDSWSGQDGPTPDSAFLVLKTRRQKRRDSVRPVFVVQHQREKRLSPAASTFTRWFSPNGASRSPRPSRFRVLRGSRSSRCLLPAYTNCFPA